ncbi:Retron-type reverse transcriptase [Desulfocicer vacuolatum DSM 3385]|uniref:Retron-type reverse transcriptase n=1 Tax=Desulfocicer vacuolatum DSM 3385 TaxID=1121400 RepID=A0A1W2A3S3_9BACT|nr:reverse transcriptase domain-containing protein [Desulfocicer vacuolatum]SMC55325.1 Retron-type reverse transcriptase [Desulfocicer vacuolatum DSM 3385]
MTVRQDFEEFLSEIYLKKIYTEHIVYSPAQGIDNLNQKQFNKILDDQIEIISRKTLNGTYKFTKYKLKLISKGKGKVPREISIPTIRDRIALKALCNFLIDRYDGTIHFDIPQVLIKNLKNATMSGRYNAFIKLDVASYYPSIKHKELKLRLGRKIRNPEIKEFIEKAIKTATVIKSFKHDKENSEGIPQGLSISNILAAIYLINIDKTLSALSEVKYFRYVDDILILCDERDVKTITQKVILLFKKIGLTIHDPEKVPEKSVVGKIGDEFSYLGYLFKGPLTSARTNSVLKLKESIVSIFSGYKHSKIKSKKFLEWRLNLRITGCIFQNKSKGWLFFFSEMNDESLLHELDHYVVILMTRFRVTIQPKKFVRSYFQIKHHKYRTKYVPNFDKYDLKMMKKVLVEYFNKSIKHLTDQEIEYEFKKRIDRQVRDLLTDVMDFGY